MQTLRRIARMIEVQPAGARTRIIGYLVNYFAEGEKPVTPDSPAPF